MLRRSLRLADPRVYRLIQKWLKADVLEDGVATVGDRVTDQGTVISRLLANIYCTTVSISELSAEDGGRPGARRAKGLDRACCSAFVAAKRIRRRGAVAKPHRSSRSLSPVLHKLSDTPAERPISVPIVCCVRRGGGWKRGKVEMV
jgi:hypothetical protein